MKTICISIVSYIFCMHISAQNIHRVACKGNVKKLDSMLSNIALDVRDSRGRSLLHWAVACKQKKVVEFLIQKGIKINATDHQQKTALHVAFQSNDTMFVDHLIRLQSGPDWKYSYGTSLLELAILNKNKMLVARLIANGIDINTKNKRGSTPLEISERIGTKDISEYLRSHGADTSLIRQFDNKGRYMGQKEPGIQPKMFAPNFISTEEEEFGAMFNSDGTAFYFGVHVNGKNEIRYSKMINGRWSKPKAIIVHERYGYNDPFLSNDEKRLYFIYDSPRNNNDKRKNIDIGYVMNTEKGWSNPINAGSTINTKGNEYYISFTNDGTMYFSSNGHIRKDTTRTDHDIYYAKFINNEFQKPVLLGEAINTEDYEADVFIAPDESYIIFCSTRDKGFGRGDLYISFKNADNQWSKAINMGPEINTSNYEYCPFVTKDGKYLFYTSNQDIYWVSTDIFDKIKQQRK
ncbi:PD40 domain-containing protein [Aquimarina sp. U1-2]|uniref:ankyrin repeat domain-containing protein n=1 Tax=Aquimarina sp. U1-2 TaxID=2823141 RepID=UPI001AECB6DE|nr:ankyrin repeat domain-containing protein [Aquimarina sp. U1-2]MBP2833016.1 PD40 domain-containing protein [Aquimarina sp. U1-2]